MNKGTTKMEEENGKNANKVDDNETIKIITEEYEKKLKEMETTYEQKLKEQEEAMTKKHNEQIRAIMLGRQQVGKTEVEQKEETEEDYVKEAVDKITKNILRRYK